MNNDGTDAAFETGTDGADLAPAVAPNNKDPLCRILLALVQPYAHAGFGPTLWGSVKK